MDIIAALATVASSLGMSMAGAWVLSKTLLSHGLARGLETHKAQLTRELEGEKASLAGAIKERVDTALADRAAEREYAWEARKRLYQLIGPLKFQLLLACRDAANRIEGHGLTAAYKTSVDAYYGINTLHRILRPIAIGELIEQNVAYADFSVDASAIALLCFKKSVALAFTGGAVVRKHPRMDWNNQTQHLFYASLSEAAHSLIVDSNGQKRIAEYHEFASRLTESRMGNSGLDALAQIVDDFAVQEKPLFWLRLVAFAHVCRQYVGSAGRDLGFDYKALPIRELLKRSGDEHIVASLDDYKMAVENAVVERL